MPSSNTTSRHYFARPGRAIAILIVVAVALFFVGGLAALAYSYSKPLPIIAEYTSRRQTYHVTLKGSTTAPWLPFFYHTMTADGRARDRVLFRDVVIYEADWLDAPFPLRFSDPDWPLENAMRFRGARGNAPGCDELFVQNHTDVSMPFLYVISRDIVLLMDIGAQREYVLPVTPHQMREHGYFGVQGRFSDGRELRRSRAAGIKRGTASHRYSAEITPAGLSLNITIREDKTPVPGCWSTRW